MELTENEEGGGAWSSACCGGDCQGRRKEIVTGKRRIFFCAMKKEVGRWPWKGKIASQMANKSPINNQNFTFKRK